MGEVGEVGEVWEGVRELRRGARIRRRQKLRQ